MCLFVALIIISFYKPGLGLQFPVNAIKRLPARTFERHVPFVSRPAIVAPPVACSSPWTGKTHYFPVNTALLPPRPPLPGPTLIGLHYRAQRWTKHAKAKTLPIADCRLPIAFAMPATIGCHECEPFHSESTGTMGIEHSWRTDIFLADKFCESCKREFQFVGR